MSMRLKKFWWPESSTWWMKVGFSTKPCTLLSEKTQRTWECAGSSWKSTWISSEESWRTVASNRMWTETKWWGSPRQSRERDSERKNYHYKFSKMPENASRWRREWYGFRQDVKLHSSMMLYLIDFEKLSFFNIFFLFNF